MPMLRFTLVHSHEFGSDAHYIEMEQSIFDEILNQSENPTILKDVLEGYEILFDPGRETVNFIPADNFIQKFIPSLCKMIESIYPDYKIDQSLLANHLRKN